MSTAQSGWFQSAWVCVTVLLLASCGGGGGSGSGGSTSTSTSTSGGISNSSSGVSSSSSSSSSSGGASSTSSSSGTSGAVAPSNLSYPSPPAFTVNATISPLMPTVTGTVASYSIAPALPAGLVISATTGVISGDPTAVTPTATYTITASNSSGSTTATVSLVVNDVAPVIAYVPYYAYTANVSAQTITPTSTGGTVTSWSIAPSLPAGLTFGSTDGSISGAPTAALTPTSFTVTADNSGGHVGAMFTIAVAASPLFDVGHVGSVNILRYNGAQLLSVDGNGHWLLQNFASGNVITSGDGVSCVQANGEGCVVNGYPLADLAGSTAMIETSTATQVIAAASGTVLASLPSGFTWYKLASDGSYVCAGNSTSLMAWSTSGQVLVSLAGDYSKAVVYATPSQINVADGPGVIPAIESILVATGVASVGANYQGSFAFWFEDGSAYLTQTGNAIWVYGSNNTQLEALTLANGNTPLFGTGSWLGVQDGGALNFYQVGGGSTPVSSIAVPNPGFGQIVPSGNTVGVFATGTPQVTVIDLSGSSPTAGSPQSVPIALLTAYAATSSSNWVVGNQRGVVLDASSRALTAGVVYGIAAGADYFSVATASGTIFSFDATTDAQVGTISFTASQLAMSSSGTVLAAVQDTDDGQYEPSGNVNIYSVPSGTLIRTVAMTDADQATLSGPGTLVGIASSTAGSAVYSIADGTQSYNLAKGGLPQFSPDGTEFAITSFGFMNSTYVFQNGGLSASIAPANPFVATSPVVWLDNATLLVGQYAVDGDVLGYVSGALYSPTGSLIGPSPVNGTSFQVLPSGALYASSANDIVSQSTGAVSWVSADAMEAPFDIVISAAATGTQSASGAATGTQVIFPSGTSVLAQPHP